jgi:glutamate carboxypeptidase
MTYRLLFILGFITLTTHVNGQKLTSQEKKIISIVDKNMPECKRLLEQVVNINSGTMNTKGVEEVGQVMSREFAKTGMTPKWITFPDSMQRAGHLFAEKKGTKGKRVLLVGHLDTVFEPESPFQKYVVQDTIAYGPGTNDMKGGNLVILYAIKALHEAGVLKDAQIIVAMHGDEEEAGYPISLSRADIISAAKRSDVALAFENSTGFNDITVARRGSSDWKLEVEGKQWHSSEIFSEKVGPGAIYEAARILNRFNAELREEYLTYSPGVILGGTLVNLDSVTESGTASGKNNIVASKVTVTGDLRFLSEDQKQRAREKMRAIVKENQPHTSAIITFEDRYPAMPPTDGNLKLLNIYSQVSIDLGLGAVKPYDPGKRGAGDISFIAQYVDCLDGLGTMGKGAHSPQEYIDLTTFDDQVKKAALMIYRLTR